MSENNSSILIVPDIHSRSFWRPVLDSDLKVCFLGDYLDGYQTLEKNVDYEHGIKEFLDIINFKKANPERVTLLLGNHDCQPLGLSNSLARYDYEHGEEIYNIFKENIDLFQFAYRRNDALFTHAGVTTKWLEQRKIEENPETIVDLLNSYKQINEEYEVPNWLSAGESFSPIGDVGRSRGGYAPNGSPIWADVQEMYHYSAFKDSLVQIIGHSYLKEQGSFIHKDNFYMCDSRSVFIWNGSELKVYE